MQAKSLAWDKAVVGVPSNRLSHRVPYCCRKIASWLQEVADRRVPAREVTQAPRLMETSRSRKARRAGRMSTEVRVQI